MSFLVVAALHEHLIWRLSHQLIHGSIKQKRVVAWRYGRCLLLLKGERG